MSQAKAKNDFDVHYVANLARLALTPEEESRLASQLGGVLSYMEKLKELDVSGVEPTAHAMPLVNVTRPDVAGVSLAHDDALANAPAKSGGLFVVPKIVE